MLRGIAQIVPIVRFGAIAPRFFHFLLLFATQVLGWVGNLETEAIARARGNGLHRFLRTTD